MQTYTIVIGGLEKTFMQKLVLYLNDRFEENIRVELLEHWEHMRLSDTEHPDMSGADTKMWNAGIGSAEFTAYLVQTHRVQQTLVIKQQKKSEEEGIYQYQSRACLFREIVSKCGMNLDGGNIPGADFEKQKWMVFTAEGHGGELAAFSLLCAWMLSERRRVLYVNFTECSGMMELFELSGYSEDMSDFLLELRRQPVKTIVQYTGRIDHLEYLYPVENPQNLREVTESDMSRLLNCISQIAQYEWIVFSVGTLVCGCEQIFLQAEKRIHLCGKNVIEECAGRDKENFVSRCAPGRRDAMIQINLPNLVCEHTGVSLLYEWKESQPGDMAAELLKDMTETGEKMI